MSTEPGGAHFYDERKQDRGSAKIVVRRKPTGRLVVLDITTTDAALGSFLRALDKAPLQVEQAGEDGVNYRFAWASGYANGAMVRVQGILLDD